MQPDILTIIENLAEAHPVEYRPKLARRMEFLERMQDFYLRKIPVAPEQQASLFTGFANSLQYAREIILLYDDLTKQLAELTRHKSK
jgi:hypothetical protein